MTKEIIEKAEAIPAYTQNKIITAVFTHRHPAVFAAR